MADKEPRPAPSIVELCFDVPLYVPFLLGPSRVEYRGARDPTLGSSSSNSGTRVSFTQQIVRCEERADRYCVACGQGSTFRGKNPQPFYDEAYGHGVILDAGRAFAKIFECAREGAHRPVFIFEHNDETITKIGQSPSLADCAEGDLARYANSLGKKSFADFRRAINAAANGIGIASFVYLRRILESLFREAHDEDAVKSEGWDEAAYQRAWMPEKIGRLARWLPVFVADHRSLYAIFSKGIHELEEAECLEHFTPLRTSVELILDERIAKDERVRKIDDSKKAVAAIESKIKGRPGGGGEADASQS